MTFRIRIRSLAGFTLIELLIVILIIGILVAIGVPAYLKYTASANDRSAQAALQVAYRAAVAGDSEVNNARFPVSTTIVADIAADEPQTSVSRGSCIATVANAPVKQVIVDTASSATQLTLCTRSASGSIWKLQGPLTGTPAVADGSTAQLMFAGNEITDALRAADIQGDGVSSPDSSTGIWEATTNLVPTGGFEAGAGTWAGWAHGSTPTPVVSQDSAHTKFGSYALKVSTFAANIDEGTVVAPITVSASTVYTASAWVYSAAPQQFTFGFDWKNNGTVVSSTNQLLSEPSGWSRMTITGTSAATANGATVVVYAHNTSGAVATTFWVDGIQLEQKPVATPYVDTNGAAASRGASRVQIPSETLNASQGWVALRARMGWASSGTTPGGGFPGLFVWNDNPCACVNQLLIFVTSAGWWGKQKLAGVPVQTPKIAQSFNVGDLDTVIFSWSGNTIALSVNGSAFSTATTGGAISSTMNPTFDIGLGDTGNWFDGDVLWFASGTGTLSGADAVLINSWGSNDPKRASFPSSAQATMVWDGTSSSGSLK